MSHWGWTGTRSRGSQESGESTRSLVLTRRVASTIVPSMTASAIYPRVAPIGPVAVDDRACARLAALLHSRSIPVDAEEVAPLGLSRRETGNFYLLVVAICHQTSPRGRPPLEGTVAGRPLRGWDYLSARFAIAVRQDPGLLKPATWTQFTAQEVASLFRDSDLGNRLTDPAGRARLIRNLGVVMHDHAWSFLEDLHTTCNGRIGSGSPNLLGLLAKFDAFRDPIQKKSFLLLAIMRNTGLVSYRDEEYLGPPVDYHEIRGHLRLGTVKVNDPQLRQKLLAKTPVSESEDLAIRGAVRDAIILIANMMGTRANPSLLHYLFWNVFRSCCTHESPHCKECVRSCPLPARYVPLAIGNDGSRRCPFAEVCDSANSIVRLQEHVFETDYY